AEDGLEDGQREPGAGLAEGAGGEGAAGQQGDVGQGRVAVEHLDEEPVDNGRWSQEATVAPRVACLAAGVVDEVATELGGEVLPEGVEGGRNPSMHRGASCAKMVENYQDARWPRSAQGVMPLKVIAVLMPFKNVPYVRSVPFVRSWFGWVNQRSSLRKISLSARRLRRESRIEPFLAQGPPIGHQ